jgi:glutaredoxin
MVISSMDNWARKIYADKFKRYLIIFLIIAGVALLYSGDYSSSNVDDSTIAKSVHFFYSPTCPHCSAQKEFNKELMGRYPNITFVYHDVSKAKESALLLDYAKKYGLDVNSLGVPATFFGNYHFLGFDDINGMGRQIDSALGKYARGEDEGFIGQAKNFDGFVELPFFGRVNVLDYSLPVLAVLLGIVDGFNPCAMWVLVYLISLIAGLNDKNRMWLLVGSFLFASGVLYFLFITAWLNVFLVVGYMKILTMIVGLFALYIGANDLRVYIKTKGALECDVGDAESKKKTSGMIRQIVESPLTWMTIFGIIGLAFVVNSIEFVCSSALPVIFTQTLTLSGLPTPAYYGYILLYLFFFMLDDIIIFSLAVFAVSSSYGHKYARYCKLIGGIILVVLGFLLVFMPDLLGRI